MRKRHSAAAAARAFGEQGDAPNAASGDCGSSSRLGDAPLLPCCTSEDDAVGDIAKREVDGNQSQKSEAPNTLESRNSYGIHEVSYELSSTMEKTR